MADTAEAIFMMTNKFSTNADEADAKTILQQFSIKRFIQTKDNGGDPAFFVQLGECASRPVPVPVPVDASASASASVSLCQSMPVTVNTSWFLSIVCHNLYLYLYQPLYLVWACVCTHCFLYSYMVSWSNLACPVSICLSPTYVFLAIAQLMTMRTKLQRSSCQRPSNLATSSPSLHPPCRNSISSTLTTIPLLLPLLLLLLACSSSFCCLPAAARLLLACCAQCDPRTGATW